MSLNDLDFDNFHDFSMPTLALNLDECWHRFWLHFGTLWHQILLCFGDCFLDDLGKKIGSKMDPILAPRWHQILCFGMIAVLISFCTDF